MLERMHEEAKLFGGDFRTQQQQQAQLFDNQFTFRNEIGWTSLILFDVQKTFKFSESQNVLLIHGQKQ